jgi:hypothetical protein
MKLLLTDFGHAHTLSHFNDEVMSESEMAPVE